MKRYTLKFLNKSSAALAQGDFERTAFVALSAIVGFSFCLYLFFVSFATWNVVERSNLDKQNSILSSAVSELELSYLSESKRINLPLAYSLGFKDSKNTIFASRAGATLSLAENE